MDDTEVIALAEKFPDLSTRELSAYRAYSGLNQPPVAPTTNASFFRLFLTGKSCSEIVELNRGFSLGQIVRARIENNWDEKRTEYYQDLMKSAAQQVMATELESMKFLSDLLSANHKLYGAKIAKFLQTGDPEELTGVPIGSFKQYKEVLQLLKEITQKNPESKVSVTHNFVDSSKVVEGEVVKGSSVIADIAKKIKGG